MKDPFFVALAGLGLMALSWQFRATVRAILGLDGDDPDPDPDGWYRAMVERAEAPGRSAKPTPDPKKKGAPPC